MIVDDDPVLRSISRLAVLTPDEERAAALRARCRARLRRTRKPARVLGPALLAGLCLLYLSALVLEVLRMPGAL